MKKRNVDTNRMDAGRNYVAVEPVFSATRKLKGYRSNVRVGDSLYYLKTNAAYAEQLPKRVKVVDETPFHIIVDMGNYCVSVNKASVFAVNDEKADNKTKDVLTFAA